MTVKITKTPENSHDFNKLIKLQEINNTHRINGRKKIGKVLRKEKMLKKFEKELEAQNRRHKIEELFYEDHWEHCSERFKELRRKIDEMKRKIREEEEKRGIESIFGGEGRNEGFIERNL